MAGIALICLALSDGGPIPLCVEKNAVLLLIYNLDVALDYVVITSSFRNPQSTAPIMTGDVDAKKTIHL